MQPRYYVIIDNNPDDRREFDDVESMQLFLINNVIEVGELFHNSLPGLKIIYNTLTGDLVLSSLEHNEWIKYSFSNDAFERKLLPIQQAIRRLAKRELLAGLYGLNDQGICSLIRNSYKFDHGTNKLSPHATEAEIDGLILK